MPSPIRGIEVFIKALGSDKVYDGSSEIRRLLDEPVTAEPLHQQPIYVDPNRPSPVSHRREPKAIHVVTWHGCYVLVSQTEPCVQVVEHTMGSAFVRNASIQGDKVWCDVYADRPRIHEVEVEVGRLLFVP